MLAGDLQTVLVWDNMQRPLQIKFLPNGQVRGAQRLTLQPEPHATIHNKDTVTTLSNTDAQHPNRAGADRAQGRADPAVPLHQHQPLGECSTHVRHMRALRQLHTHRLQAMSACAWACVAPCDPVAMRQLLELWCRERPLTLPHVPHAHATHSVHDTTRDLCTSQDFTVVLDINTIVNESNDRGLLSLVAHPQFPTQPYYYMIVRTTDTNTQTHRQTRTHI